MASPLLRVDGAGSANLGSEAIDYGLTVAIVGSLEGQDAKDLAELKGLSLPLKITGTFSEPKPRIDMANLMQAQAKEKLKAALAEKLDTEKLQEKLQDKLGDQMGEQLGDKLGGLLGAGKSAPAAGKAPQTTGTAAESKSDAAPEEAPKSIEEQATDALGDKLKGLF